jgi:outer membrane protein assembly factor BamB
MSRALVVITCLAALAAGSLAGETRTVVVAGSTSGEVLVVDAATGKPVWRRDLGAAVRGAPVLEGSRVLVATSNSSRGRKEREGRVVALDLPSGEVIWERLLGVPIDHAVAVAKGRVIAGAEDGSVHALSIERGEPVWRTDLARPGPSSRRPIPIVRSPAVVGENLVVVTGDGAVHVLVAATGQWVRSTEKPPAGLWRNSPVVIGEEILLAEGGRSGVSGRLRRLDARTGRERWELRGIGSVSGVPTVANGVVYVLSQDVHLYAVDAESGKLRWGKRVGAEELSFHSGFRCPPLVRGDEVFVLGTEFRVLRVIDGEELRRFPLDVRTNGLVAAGDLVVAGTYTLGCAKKIGGPGALLAIEPRTGKIRWRVESGNGGFVGVPVVGKISR